MVVMSAFDDASDRPAYTPPPEEVPAFRQVKITQLISATVGEAAGIRTHHYCWTPAHYEEQMALQAIQDQTRPPLTQVIHLHRHLVDCNERCVIREVIE